MNTKQVTVDSGPDVIPQIADYEVIKEIGQGAYGKVWLARNIIGGFRAVKVIHRETFKEERLYQREFNGICKFGPISGSHPGLVAILHVGQSEAPRYFYYVMELADDVRTGPSIAAESYTTRTLKEEMANHPHLPMRTKLNIALSLTSAVGYIHEQGLIHRDIKPSNIIFVKGSPKIADIGLVTEAGQNVSHGGTSYYLPPEGPGAPTGDIYSLGKVFYELFMGLPPKQFPELPDAAEEFTTVPELLQVNNLILKACHQDSRRRFQTARELYNALQGVAGTVGEKQSSTGTAVGQASLKPDREAPSRTMMANAGGTTDASKAVSGEQRVRRWPRIVGLSVLLLAVAAALFFFLAHNEHVLVLMDTTAERGIYDLDNKKNGNSNAKEVAEALRVPELREALPPEQMHEVPVGLNWARKDHVRSLRPHLLIIHRSVFYHPWAAELSLPYPPFETDAEFNTFAQRYKTLGDMPVREFLGDIGTAVRRTHFLIYSRGTDTNWLSEAYRQAWVQDIESQYPALAGRVTTMLIPGDQKGTFRDPETRLLIRSNVVEILKLPKRGALEKRH